MASTQFFRNSPWLVLLFTIMLLFPFEIDLGFRLDAIESPEMIEAARAARPRGACDLRPRARGRVRAAPR